MLGLKYYKKWEESDFTGKYHLGRFAEKIAPIPGTQILEEMEHERRKKDDVERFSHEMDVHMQACENRIRTGQEFVKLRTRVAFSSTVTDPIDTLEEIEREKESELFKAQGALDPMPDIEKFLLHVKNGKTHYIGYVVAMGYKSIDYQDETNGNTALHHAVRLGLVDMVEELLKYRATADMKNRFGNCPVHDCWLCWRTPLKGDIADRREQEAKTMRMLFHLFSYNADPDSHDQQGNTALHIAAKLGPSAAVIMILGFKASVFVKNKNGQTPIDIAQESSNKEVAKLLKAWPHVVKSMVTADFTTMWRKFFKNPRAVINNAVSAEEVLSMLNMEGTAKELKRLNDELNDHSGGALAVKVDDPMLRQVCEDWRKHGLNPLTPWSKEWVFFKNSHRQNAEGDVEGSDGHNHINHLMAQAQGKSATREFPDRPTPLRVQVAYGLGKESVHDILLGEEEKQRRLSKALEDSLLAPRMGEFQKRRLKTAHSIALDGKFGSFTKRGCLKSCLNIPLRTADAPLLNTVEENDIMRLLTAQGRDFELASRTKKVDLYEKYGLKKKISLNPIGQYADSVQFAGNTDREKLLNSVVNDNLALHDDEAVGASNSLLKAVQYVRADRLDLVHERRKRFVDKDLIPPNFVKSSLETLQDDLEKTRKSDNLKQLIAFNSRRKVDTTLSGSSDIELPDSEAELKLKLRLKAIQKNNIEYGKGRLLSTHNLKGEIAPPWEFVSGDYAPLPGDRTV